MGTIALIDGDVIAYRVAWTCENNTVESTKQDEGIAYSRTNELMDRILNSTKTAEYQLYISGSDNFRKLLDPEYKLNRNDKPRPRLLDTIRNFLVREWGAEVTAGYEADDGIGIAGAVLSSGGGEKRGVVYCSNDKDFRQLVGRHYNFVKDTFEDVDSEMATLAFWSHMLIGDTSDNVRGVFGLGPVKSRRLLEGLSAEEMEDCVRTRYADDDRFFLNRVLLRILQSEQEYLEIEDQIRQGKRPPFTAGSS